MDSAARLRGQARRTRQLLTAQLQEIEDRQRDHLARCPQCGHAGDNYYRRCESGWEIIKQYTRAKNTLLKYDENHSSQQGELF